MDDRLAVDFVRLRLLTEPAKKSPIEEPGRELKRFLEIASRPKMDALERAVGVEGREFLSVLKWKRPN